jgi:uncharacterized protein (DUF934 family)
MPQLIKHRVVVEDSWALLRDAVSLDDVPATGPVLVPVALWLSAHDALLARRDVGVWLHPDDDPELIASDLARLPVVAVDFPTFSDGRGYSTARLLRDRFGYKGELRAIGDVLRDQLYYLNQVGFDAFAIRADRSADDALKGLDDFVGSYASTAREPRPRFGRRIGGPGDVWFPCA